MEIEPPASQEFQIEPTFDEDLEPIYALTEAQYQSVINRLSNLLMTVIQQLHDANNPDMARQVADQAGEVLMDYDDDVAEYVRWVGWRSEANENLDCT